MLPCSIEFQIILSLWKEKLENEVYNTLSSLIIVGCTVVIHSVHRTTELDFDCGKENKKEKNEEKKTKI